MENSLVTCNDLFLVSNTSPLFLLNGVFHFLVLLLWCYVESKDSIITMMYFLSTCLWVSQNIALLLTIGSVIVM